MKIIDNNAKLAGVLAVSLLILTFTLTHQSPTSIATNQYYEDASISEAQAIENNLAQMAIERSDTEPVEPTWSLRQPRIGSLIEDEDDVKQIVTLRRFIQTARISADAEGIMWLQMAIDTPSLLQDSKGSSVSKHEFAHGLNMPWKVTGNI
jgi:hypothetical protein